LRDLVQLKKHTDNLKFDPADLELIEERLDLWNKLKRKYGKTFEEIVKFSDSSKKQLELIEHAEESIQILERDKRKVEEEYFELANKLSKTRREIAEKLMIKIVSELERLNMKGANFKVDIESNSNKISIKGIDDVSFLLSSNQGEPLKPLERIASGGEISRVMLALKTSVHEAFKTSTMVFDEIDAGIGGRTALLVADKIKEVSKECQIICITHLAQIASLPGVHIKVIKDSDGERTTAEVITIDKNDKLKEIARMLSGDENNTESLQTAEKMIKDHLTTEEE